MSRSVAAVAAGCIALLGGCERPSGGAASPPAGPWFAEQASTRGLRFEQDSGAAATGRYFMPEIMVGGAALLDIDGDGDLDAYLVQAGSLLDEASRRPPNRLFRNRGDGTFEDVTAGSGADDRGYGAGAAAGDYDGDGDVDLYVTNVGPNVLLANDGDGTFTDVTAAAGVGDPGWGASAAWVDYDLDGDLDLFACNYLRWSVATKVDCYAEFHEGLDYCGPKAIDRPAVDVLYRNEGDGTFTDVTVAAGLGDTRGAGLGVVTGDFNGDGWPDLFVANDAWPDRLWANRGDGTFEDVALLAGCSVAETGAATAGMGVTAGDIDDDGDLDLMVCNLAAEPDSVFRNEGRYFTNVTAATGITPVSRPFTRFGIGWVDFDNDGRLDLYQANGRVKRHEREFAADVYAEPNSLFAGRPGGRFEVVRPSGGTDPELIAASRAAAFGDVDDDGGVDVLVVNRDGPAHLLMNRVAGRGRWLLLKVVDERGRDALGATVTVRAGDRTLRRQVRTAYSYLAANDPRVHVGLGDSPRAAEVSVQWPDGTVESFGSIDADRIATLRRGVGRPLFGGDVSPAG